MYTQFIQTTLNYASQLANQSFGKVSSISVKAGDNNQVLTETDLAIGKYIVEQISQQFPDYNIIDEEAGVVDKKSEFTWVVDPIDGTSNFANGLPTYGVMMGLLKGDQAIAGGIALPAFNQLYWAEKGEGAFMNGEKIAVSTETQLSNSLICYGIDGHQENPELTRTEIKTLGEIVLAIRNLRSSNSAYDMAHTADGKFGVYLNQTSKIWDNVAIHPIIEEAGGIVTDYWGKAMDYSDPLTRIDENFTLCAGAPELHRQVQEIIGAG